MAYQKQNWIDYPDETTPISAERLLHIEDGIESASDNADDAIENGLKTLNPSYSGTNVVDNVFSTGYLVLSGKTLNDDDYESPNSAEIATSTTMQQYKALADSEFYALRHRNSINLIPYSTEFSSFGVYYVDSEHTEQAYTWESGVLPARLYYINGSTNLPGNIKTTDIPTRLDIYKEGDIVGRSLTAGGDLANIKSNSYNIEYTYITNMSGDSVAIALLSSGSNYYLLVVGIDITNHTINQNNIGYRYAQGKYLYYAMNIIFGGVSDNDTVIDDSIASLNTTYSSKKIVADVFGDTTWSTVNSVTIVGGSMIPVPFYSTNLGETWESYTSYSGNEGALIFYPWNNSDIPMAITLTYMDGTEVVGQVLDKADLTTYDLSYGYATGLTNFTYYHIDNDIALVLIVTNSSIYMYLVNTTIHTVLGTHGLLSISTSREDCIQSVQIYSQRCGLINDYVTNTTNTYSSAKIQQVIGESFSDIMDELYKIKYKEVVVNGGTLGNLEIINHETTPNTYVAYAPDTTVISGQPNRYVKATLDSGFDLDKVESVTVTNTSTGFNVTVQSPFDSFENIFASHAPDGTDLGFDWQVCGIDFGEETVGYLLFAQMGTDLFISYIKEDPETYEYYLTLTDSNLLEVGDDLSGLSVTFKVNRFDD